MTPNNDGAMIYDNKFSRFDKELIDKYFNDKGKRAIAVYITDRERAARLDELEALKDYIDEMEDQPIIYRYRQRIAELEGTPHDTE